MSEHFVLSEDDVVDMLLYPGWRADLEAGHGERARREVLAHLDRWRAEGLSVREIAGVRHYDPIALNVITERGLAGTDPFWRERAVEPRRAVAAQIGAGPDPRELTYELRREIVVADRGPGSQVIATMALPVDEPTQRDVVVTALPGSDARLTITPGRLTVRATVDAEQRVRFGIRIAALATPHPTVVDPARVERAEPVAPYLGRDEGLIRITPAIDALAHQLTRPRPWDTVLACWDHVFDRHQLGSLYHFELDRDDPLGAVGPWVDCYVGSALFIALVRAAGIPARMVAGALIYPGADMGLHYWSEVLAPPYGWLPFDLHGWILAAGDRHEPTWGRALVGQLPYRLVFDRLPRAALELGLRYPPRWYSTTKHDGLRQRYQVFDLDTRALAFTDDYVATLSPRTRMPAVR